MSCRTSPDSRRRRKYGYAGIARGAFPVEGLAHARTANEEIKNYAENTMNELLGWYGYGKVGAVEAQNPMNRLPSSSSSSPQRTDGASPKSRGDDISDDVSDPGSSLEAISSEAHPLDFEGGVSNCNATIICAWCQKKGLKLFTLKTSEGQYKTFCSELCFDQCRRAAFKKNRTCDWCKHIRHTVNYVDFQDKDHQLQFCSNKCLNQYKMNIFCKETQAYLQLHPQESNNGNPGCSRSNSPNLITPDLWMRDCKEPEIDDSEEDIPDKSDVKLELMSPSTSPSNEERYDVSDLSMNKKDKLPNDSISISNAVYMQDKLSNEVSGMSSSQDKSKIIQDRRKRKQLNPDRDATSSLREIRPSRLRTMVSRQSHNSSSTRLLNKLTHSETPAFRPVSPPTNYPQPLLMNGIASSRSATSTPSVIPSMPVTPGSLSQSGLPPPPPLLSSELFHAPFQHSPMYHQAQSFSSAQQQLENFLLMQNSLRMRMGVPSHRPVFPEPSMPTGPINLSSAPNTSSTVSQQQPPSSVMLPYPLMIPFPVPIPIPIPLPLSQFLQATKQPSDKSRNAPSKSTTTEEQAKRVDDIITRLMTKHNAQKSDQETGNDKSNIGCAADSSLNDEENSSPSTIVSLHSSEKAICSIKEKRKKSSDNIKDRSKRHKMGLVNF